MNNFIDWKVSSRVTSEFRRVVTGKTDIVTMSSGRERRNAAWKFKRMSFTATFAKLSAKSQDEITNAFYAANAQLYLFRFRDPGDHWAEDTPFDTSAAVGTTNPVQLTKRYQFGPSYADRTIQAVSTCTVNGAGGAVIAGTFDNALGTFTPAAAWGSGQYTWTGTFDLWVRFNSDELDMTMKTVDVSTADVELIEGIATVVTGS